MHVSLLFKVCDSICHIKSAFGQNFQDGHCAFKIKFVGHYVNSPCQFFNSQKNILIRSNSDFSIVLFC